MTVATSTTTATASCPSGTYAIGGGGQTSQSSKAVYISVPVLNASNKPVGWTVSVTGGDATATAICLSAT